MKFPRHAYHLMAAGMIYPHELSTLLQETYLLTQDQILDGLTTALDRFSDRHRHRYEQQPIDHIGYGEFQAKTCGMTPVQICCFRGIPFLAEYPIVGQLHPILRAFRTHTLERLGLTDIDVPEWYL